MVRVGWWFIFEALTIAVPSSVSGFPLALRARHPARPVSCLVLRSEGGPSGDDPPSAGKQQPPAGLTVAPGDGGAPIDWILSRRWAWPAGSRREFRRALSEGRVTVDGLKCRNFDRRVRAGQVIALRPATGKNRGISGGSYGGGGAAASGRGGQGAGPPARHRLVASPLLANGGELCVLYEDAALIAVNKPHGVVVHPCDSVPEGTTLLDAIFHHLLHDTRHHPRRIKAQPPSSAAAREAAREEKVEPASDTLPRRLTGTDKEEMEEKEKKGDDKGGEEEEERRSALALALSQGVVHRLDKATSGVVVVAKTLEASAHLSRQFAAKTIFNKAAGRGKAARRRGGEGEGGPSPPPSSPPASSSLGPGSMEKVYLAVCVGRDPGPDTTVAARLVRQGSGTMKAFPEPQPLPSKAAPKGRGASSSSASSSSSSSSSSSRRVSSSRPPVPLPAVGVEARTRFRAAAVWGPYSLCEVDLYTGRLHQIRAHAVHRGHPVVGDAIYGGTGGGGTGTGGGGGGGGGGDKKGGGWPLRSSGSGAGGRRDGGRAAKDLGLSLGLSPPPPEPPFSSPPRARNPARPPRATAGGRAGRDAAAAAEEGQMPMLLHAWRLSLKHPTTGELLDLTAPLPESLAAAASTIVARAKQEAASKTPGGPLPCKRAPSPELLRLFPGLE